MDKPDLNQMISVARKALADGNIVAGEAIARSALGFEANPEAFEILESVLMEGMLKRSTASVSTLNPVDRFIMQHFVHLRTGHFDCRYHGWTMRRIEKVFEVYGIDFEGKRILEIGAGIGEVGGIFAELGAEVVGLEGRITNCNFTKLRYRHLKNYKIVQCNLEEDFTRFGRFDLVINFGTVEMIHHFEQMLQCCMAMSDTLFLETMVCDSTDPFKVIYIDMPADRSDWPLAGKSSRPSPAYIERLFMEQGFEVHRHFDHDLDTFWHSYTWAHQNDNRTDNPLRRYWSFTRNKPA